MNTQRWDVLAATITASMKDTNMRQVDLCRESGLSIPTVRAFMSGQLRSEQPTEHTIRRLEEGLMWPPGSVARILAGEEPGHVLESVDGGDADVSQPAGSAPLAVRVSALEGQVERLALLVGGLVRATIRDATSERITLDQLLELLRPAPESEARTPDH